ncbi:fibrinogen alpha chain [Boleophthalmus pectinirostris]|uniref:fibrinogen alpha chain n=1 Tax=Boleophthalmus pectinirostris TaxID=150288 RepID=UPI000A1C479A|nr:fibrinogen alpha chain [Boleophthalmus pectinirostris]
MNHCGRKTHLPLCTEEDWVSSCPSGCRIQGLILEHEKKVENKLRKICKLKKTYKDAMQKTMAATARIYHDNREHIMSEAALQVRFVKAAEDLTKNLTSLWKRSESLELKITELKEKVQKQVEELLRTEVEVDMRVRSCLGSCQSASSLSVNLEDYAALGSEMEKMHNKEKKSKSVKPEMIPQIRTAPVDFGPDPSPVYKTIKTVLDEGLNLFEDLRPNQLELDDIYDLSELE